MTRLEVLPGLRFTCSGCGDCCSGWNVVLGAGERGRIEALGIVSDAAVVALPDGRTRLARRADGTCVFLGERRQCLIHERAGPEAKPLVCRLYPFSFEPVGDRVGVDVAFSCRAVSEGAGAPVADRLAEWEELLAANEAGETSASPARKHERHRLTRRHAASPEVILELEHTLVAFLLDPVPPLLDRVRTCLEYVRLATTGDPSTPQAAVLRETLARALPAGIARRPAEGRLDATQRAVFRTYLYLALNPPPADLGEWPARRQAAEAERRDALAQAFRDGRGVVAIDNRELTLGHDDIARIEPGVLAHREPGLLAKFLAAKILGQRFLRAGAELLPLVDAVPRLLLSLPMVAWAAKALAAERGARAVAEPDLGRALRLADRTLGTLSLRPLPKASREAFEFVLEETDVVVAAWLEVVDPGGER